MAFAHEKMLERTKLFKEKLLSMDIDISTMKRLSAAALHGYRKKGNVPKGDSLEEWGSRFNLSLDWLLWNEDEMLRSQEDSGKLSEQERTIMELALENRQLRKEIEALLQAHEASQLDKKEIASPSPGKASGQ